MTSFPRLSTVEAELSPSQLQAMREGCKAEGIRPQEIPLLAPDDWKYWRRMAARNAAQRLQRPKEEGGQGYSRKEAEEAAVARMHLSERTLDVRDRRLAKKRRDLANTCS